MLKLFILLSVFALVGQSYALKRNNPDEMVYTPCVNQISHPRSVIEADLKSWETCKYQRSEIIDYMKRGFDLNNDGVWTIDECEFARLYYFNELERMLGETCQTVFFRCDCDGDGQMTIEDFENSRVSCLRNCVAAGRIKALVLDKMPTSNAFEGKLNIQADKSVFNDG